MITTLRFACLLIILASAPLFAQITSNDYVTTWKTNLAGTSAANQITIPALGEYTVYYESIPSGISGALPEEGTFQNEQTITFPAPGTYRVAIKPTGATPFHRIDFTWNGNRQKLLTIEQWGSTAWSSFENAYAECENLSAISAADVPLLSRVTSMGFAFRKCSKLGSAPEMDRWNVSHVIHMNSMFEQATSFNQPIGSWDVSSVTSMRFMFAGAIAFNQPLNNWNVSAVTDMTAMFSTAKVFNQPIGHWDVSSVSYMGSMFRLAESFNQPIGSWDVSAARRMNHMFSYARSFNQPLDNWNVAGVTNMDDMFSSAWAFNQSLAKWNLKSIEHMNFMLLVSGMSCSNYNATLVGWAANPDTPSGITFEAYPKTYGTEAIAARNFLVNTKGWTILRDTFDPACTALPVTLVSFHSKMITENKVELIWETSQESFNDRFVVERSKDLVLFEPVAEVRDVAGTSTTSHTYRIVDSAPYKGTSYYRLLQYDADGTRTVSRAISVVVRSEAYMVYPNPAPRNAFRVSIDEPGTARIQLYNTSGRAIDFKRKIHDEHTVEIMPAQPVEEGGYTVSVSERGAHRTFKLILK